MTASKLNKFVRLAKDKSSDWFDVLNNTLSISEKVQILKEYNETKNPSLEQTLVVSAITINGYYEDKPIRDKEIVEQILQAYDKCAQNLAKVKDAKLDSNKYDLGRNIKSFVCGNPEYSAKGLNILDKYLTDVDVIAPICTCMLCDNSLMDNGFAAIHKSVDNVCAKHPNAYNFRQHLNSVFADLYNLSCYLKSVEMIDKITSSFSEFEKQMDPNLCNLNYICDNARRHYALDGYISEKMAVLSVTFDKWRRGDEPFKEVYAREINNHSFMEMVKQKVEKRAKSDVYSSHNDSEQKTLKKEGKDKEAITRKMLSQVHNECKIK